MPILTLTLTDREVIDIVKEYYGKDYVIKSTSFSAYEGGQREPSGFSVSLKVEKKPALNLPGIPGY